MENSNKKKPKIQGIAHILILILVPLLAMVIGVWRNPFAIATVFGLAFVAWMAYRQLNRPEE